MNFNEYQELASRTAKNDMHKDFALCNWAMGLAGEAGEYVEIIKKKVFHRKELDLSAAAKELGDCLWYMTMCAKELGLSLESIAQGNILKLQKRYPEKFEDGGGIRE